MKIIKKAYQIDLNKIEEGYLYSEWIVYASDRNTARSQLLKEIRYENMVSKQTNNEVDYISIPVIRCNHEDIVEYEGKEVKRCDIDKLIREMERLKELDLIRNDDSIKYCYIRKRGSYYCDNYCGYTDYKEKAGIYIKSDAISEAISCDEISLIPIDIEEHNKYVNDKIQYLKSKLL